MSKYKIIMTGGGTAGHVTPNLALVPKLKERDFEIKYIGSYDGIEKEIIGDAGIPYYAISSGKLRRYFDMKNFSDPFKVIKGVAQAIRILSKEKPDVIFSKGGFVAVPVVIAASMKKIPVVSHESDLTPGLANKLSAPFCDKLCVTFRESLKYIKDGKGELTGTPIREEILKGRRILGKEICNFRQEKEVILVIGGSLGAKNINDLYSQIDSFDSIFQELEILLRDDLCMTFEQWDGFRHFIVPKCSEILLPYMDNPNKDAYVFRTLLSYYLLGVSIGIEKYE